MSSDPAAAASGTGNGASIEQRKGEVPDVTATPAQAPFSEATKGDLPEEVVSQIKASVSAQHGTQAASKVDRKTLAEIMSRLNLERDSLLKNQESKQKGSKAIADHKFWKTQPVARPDDAPLLSSSQEGPIQPAQPPHEVKQDAYPLPKDFEWVTVDIDDEEECKEVYELLSANYVEDDDASLRFDYAPEFLKWVLKHPGYKKTWHVGVRVSSTKKLVAFISGIPHELRVRENAFQTTEINFLCVHKKLRSKRLAPVLIKEVTRQCHLTGIFQAIYTVGVVLPTPVSCSRYYHRTLNAPKLLDIGFAAVPSGLSREKYVQKFALPDEPKLKGEGLREMEERDVEQVGKLLRKYMRRFDMAPRFGDEEVKHVLLSGRGTEKDGKRLGQVTWTFVIEDPNTKRITDMFSFYSLPSSVLDSAKHGTLEAAYLFYYATDVPFRHASSSSPSSSPKTLAVAAEASASGSSASAALEPWQRTNVTRLTPQEVEDEANVTRWDEESAEVKSALKARLNQLVGDLLIIAKQNKFDVVNCLTVMDNPLILSDQLFGPGDGLLRWYLFNWRVQPIAGGMGLRPGEADQDPVVAHMKAAFKAGASPTSSALGSSSTTPVGNSSEAELIRYLQTRPGPERGSGKDARIPTAQGQNKLWKRWRWRKNEFAELAVTCEGVDFDIMPLAYT
ncbi:glycylpeptide n-tetradecanoyltransferase [Ceraceosorus bombacis]|uniref:Glycylpeptide N-tetradecanoyltransferase n=1 Tax=Ceraceosorus bombacis TaxID=401625 RepID=A0A0P1BA27_9BASI|nr:glycylpeptide n-tetradecanoyltransferase [Ceraceosorus bombacis]